MKVNYLFWLIGLIAGLHTATAQVFFEERLTGHADISSWYKVGKFKITLGPCFDAGRGQENIDLHVPSIRQEYSFQDLWVKHSTSKIILCKGTVKLDTIKNKIWIDLYEDKDGQVKPLAINGKHKLKIEKLKNFRDGERFPDNCIFNKKVSQ